MEATTIDEEYWSTAEHYSSDNNFTPRDGADLQWDSPPNYDTTVTTEAQGISGKIKSGINDNFNLIVIGLLLVIAICFIIRIIQNR